MDIEQAKNRLYMMSVFDAFGDGAEDLNAYRDALLSGKVHFYHGCMTFPRLYKRFHSKMQNWILTIAPALADDASWWVQLVAGDNDRPGVLLVCKPTVSDSRRRFSVQVSEYN